MWSFQWVLSTIATIQSLTLSENDKQDWFCCNVKIMNLDVNCSSFFCLSVVSEIRDKLADYRSGLLTSCVPFYERSYAKLTHTLKPKIKSEKPN